VTIKPQQTFTPEIEDGALSSEIPHPARERQARPLRLVDVPAEAAVMWQRLTEGQRASSANSPNNPDRRGVSVCVRPAS
jgi:hypothetical protein